MRTLVCWFRRDLRVRDQTALYHAARDAARVIPLFIVDPALMAAPHGGGPRVAFLLDSLRALDENLRRLGGYLLVRQGDPREVLLGVLRLPLPTFWLLERGMEDAVHEGEVGEAQEATPEDGHARDIAGRTA